MSDHVILLSVPGLRSQDLLHMPHLRALMGQGDQATLVPSFPCVTCPVQANMTTGVLPDRHGVIANGFYWRERHEVEMWTAWNDCILAPQIWDTLHEQAPGATSAVWFPLHSKGCGADYICTPAPKHNVDGSESLWCYTRPETLYLDFVSKFDHFPLQHFWGPLANIFSSEWIADTAVEAARRYRPNFFYIYLPQLDYAAQKEGPDSSIARASVESLDQLLGKFAAEMQAAYPAPARLLWLVASEYAIVPVDHVTYPNRLLRAAGLLSVNRRADGEFLDFVGSKAWALVDHQLAHVFVADRDEQIIGQVVDVFRQQTGIAEVLAGNQRQKYDMVHDRSGDVILVSTPNSWQAYYWWLDDELAPPFARKVDIHNKPGYDPCEMHIDTQRMGISLNPSLVQGSHGAPALEERQRGIILASQRGVFDGQLLADIDVHALVLRQFGI